MQHIDSGSTLRNFKLTISYDGRQFHGWQILVGICQTTNMELLC